MFVWRRNKMNGKLWKKNENENFFKVCLVGKRKFYNSNVFSHISPKSSLLNGEENEERNWASHLDKNAHIQLHLHPLCFLHIFLFFFFSYVACLSLSLSLSWFTGQALPASLSFFFFLFFPLFFWFTGLVVFFFFFFSFFFFLLSFVFFNFLFRCDFFYGHDFYFLINLGDWFFFFWLFTTFWVLIWHHFFNKGISVNLYKLTFFIPSFFHSQPNKKEGN